MTDQINLPAYHKQQKRLEVAQQLGSLDLVDALWFFIEEHGQWSNELTNDAFFALRGRVRADREEKSAELYACPNCKSTNVSAEGVEQSSYDPEYVSQSVTCLDCETDWKNMFQFSGSEEY